MINQYFQEHHFLLFLSTWGVPSSYATVTTITVVSLFNTILLFWWGNPTGGETPPAPENPNSLPGGEPPPRWWVRLLLFFFFLVFVGCVTIKVSPPDYTVFYDFRGLYIEILYQQDTTPLVSSYFQSFDPPPEGGLDLYREILNRLERAHRIEKAFSASQPFITGLAQSGFTPGEIKTELTPRLTLLIGHEISKLHK